MSERYNTARERLALALSNVPMILDDGVRGSVLLELRMQGYDVPPPAGPVLLQCRIILGYLLASRGGLRALTRVISQLDQSTAADRFADLVNEMLPESWLTLPEKYEIIDLISRACRAERLAAYYAQAVGREPETVLQDAEDFIGRLGQEAEDATRLSPLLLALEIIAEDLAEAPEAAECRDKATRIAVRIDETAIPDAIASPQAEQLRARRQAGAAGDAAAGVEDAYIVVVIDPSDVRPHDQFGLSCLLYYGERLVGKLYSADRLSMAEVPVQAMEAIGQALELAEQVRGSNFRPMVEFVLPREQLNLAVEEWHAESSYLSLGTQFAVVVRDLKRQRDPFNRHANRQKWGHAAQRLRSRGLTVSMEITCGDTPRKPRGLYEQLLADTMIAVGLTYPPGCPAHQLELGELLDSGVAVMLWPHRCDHGDAAGGTQASDAYAEFRDRLKTMTSHQPMSELPHIVYELRKSMAGAPGSDGVALLWDDPGRAVQPSQYRLAAPGRAGAAR